MPAPLTQEEQNKLFKHIADTHIDLANSQLEGTDIHIASSGFVYGAARFNAFTIASEAKDLKSYNETRKGAVAHYTKMFKNMLEENLDNYKDAFTTPEEPRYSHLVNKK